MGNRSLRMAAFGKSESENQSCSVVHLFIESRTEVSTSCCALYL